jgi:hypothetical protein
MTSSTQNQPERLPFVDVHTVHVAAPPAEVWASLEHHVGKSLRFPPGHPLPRVLNAQPRTGFDVAERSPTSRLRLVGRHRFSDYALEFDLEGVSDGTFLRAKTFAVFPGIRGRVYRALVIGSGGHRLLVRRFLRSVSRASPPSPRR